MASACGEQAKVMIDSISCNMRSQLPWHGGVPRYGHKQVTLEVALGFRFRTRPPGHSVWLSIWPCVHSMRSNRRKCKATRAEALVIVSRGCPVQHLPWTAATAQSLPTVRAVRASSSHQEPNCSARSHQGPVPQLAHQSFESPISAGNAGASLICSDLGAMGPHPCNCSQKRIPRQMRRGLGAPWNVLNGEPTAAL